MTIRWRNDRRKLGDLIPNPDNPRFIREENAARLAASLDKFGQPETIAIGPNNELYNGHQRLTTWLKRYGPDYEVDVRVSERPLTDDEWREFVVTIHDGTSGTWDMEAIDRLYRPDELEAWGFPTWGRRLLDDDLYDGGDEVPEPDPWLDDEPVDGLPAKYTRKIKPPIYQPREERPDIALLFDSSRTLELLREIDAADGITDAERTFLRMAAYRHTVLRFDRIADYYAYAGPAMKHLMEESAVVIIDFDRAIELGFVRLSKDMLALLEKSLVEYDNADEA